MATAGERVTIVAAGWVGNVADAIRAGGYVGQDKDRLFAVSGAGFNLEISKAC